MAMKLGFQGKAVAEASEQMQNLYELFVDVDATQVEINPFGLTPQNQGTEKEKATPFLWPVLFFFTKCARTSFRSNELKIS